ncbi:MAG: hypothetical protein ACRCY0_03140 [Synechococcus elongatus]
MPITRQPAVGLSLPQLSLLLDPAPAAAIAVGTDALASNID